MGFQPVRNPYLSAEMPAMPSIRGLSRLSACVCLALAIWLVSAPAVQAAPPPVVVVPEKGYVKEYALVVLGIALGLLIVCRSAHRTTEIKYEDD